MNQSILSTLITVTAFGTFLFSAPRLNSQEPAPVVKSPTELLNALKTSNADLIQKQQKTLEKLEVIKKEAEQLRIMAKRS